MRLIEARQRELPQHCLINTVLVLHSPKAIAAKMSATRTKARQASLNELNLGGLVSYTGNKSESQPSLTYLLLRISAKLYFTARLRGFQAAARI